MDCWRPMLPRRRRVLRSRQIRQRRPRIEPTHVLIAHAIELAILLHLLQIPIRPHSLLRAIYQSLQPLLLISYVSLLLSMVGVGSSLQFIRTHSLRNNDAGRHVSGLSRLIRATLAPSSHRFLPQFRETLLPLHIFSRTTSVFDILYVLLRLCIIIISLSIFVIDYFSWATRTNLSRCRHLGLSNHSFFMGGRANTTTRCFQPLLFIIPT